MLRKCWSSAREPKEQWSWLSVFMSEICRRIEFERNALVVLGKTRKNRTKHIGNRLYLPCIAFHWREYWINHMRDSRFSLVAHLLSFKWSIGMSKVRGIVSSKSLFNRICCEPFKKIYLFIYLAALGLNCSMWGSCCVMQGLALAQ